MNEPNRIEIDGKSYELSCHEVQDSSPKDEGPVSNIVHGAYTMFGIPVGILIVLLGSWFICQMFRDNESLEDIAIAGVIIAVLAAFWPILLIIAGIVIVPVAPTIGLGYLCKRVRDARDRKRE